jgi:hypothetical protein
MLFSVCRLGTFSECHSQSVVSMASAKSNPERDRRSGRESRPIHQSDIVATAVPL